MKANKRTLKNISLPAKAMYLIGCMRYTEKNRGKDPFQKDSDIIDYKFTIRRLHPVSIIFFIVVIIIMMFKGAVDACKEICKDNVVASGDFLRKRNN